MCLFESIILVIAEKLSRIKIILNTAIDSDVKALGTTLRGELCYSTG